MDEQQEYDVAEEEDFEALEDEPGIPDEMVEAALVEEPPSALGFNQELAVEASPLLIAAILAMVLTEAVKPWLKVALHGKGEDAQKRMIQSLPFLFGALTSYTFGFHTMVLDLTGVMLSWVESLLYGGASVGVVALVIYEFIHSIRPIKLARVRFYRFVGVTEEEMKTVKGEPPITMEQIEADRKAKGLDK